MPVSGADAAYYFSTYNAPDSVPVSSNKKVMILGGGRTGSGGDRVRLHLCTPLSRCVTWAESIWLAAIRKRSLRTTTSNKLYFEALTVEDVLSIYEKESRRASSSSLAARRR